jgi:hypothetical protein
MDTNSPQDSHRDLSDAESLDQLRASLASSDPAVVIANHCYGLFELAAVYLGEQPPRLVEAQFAIDALSGLVDASGSRLGDAGSPIAEGLAQLRLAWVQISAMAPQEEQ